MQAATTFPLPPIVSTMMILEHEQRRRLMEEEQQLLALATTLLPATTTTSPTWSTLIPLERQLRLQTLQQQQQQQQRRAPRRRTVRFPDNPVEAAHSSDRSDEEVENSWYSNNDIELFQVDKKRTVRALHKVGGDLLALDHRKYCVRGFESYQSWRLHDAMRRQRKRVLQTTLKTQRGCGEKMHKFTTKWARELASIDAKERYDNDNDNESDDERILQEIRNCKRKLRIQQKRKRRREEAEENASLGSASTTSTISTTSSVITPLQHEGGVVVKKRRSVAAPANVIVIE